MDTRRCFFSARIMASEELQAISVTDVYDQAAGIAHEFDKLIHTYGNDCVTELMPKVIRSLEQLENLTSRYETDVEEINQLRYKVEKLENEKTEKAQDRVKFEQEMIIIEDNWQIEVKELLSVVSRLQDENKRLKDDIRSEKHELVAEIKAQQQETEEQEIKVLTKLKETVDKQRQELRQLKREQNQKSIDCEALSAQLERIAKVNADLRRKNSSQKKQSKNLLEEKAELELMLHTKDVEVERIKDKMTEQEKYDEQRAAVKEVLRQSRSVEDEDGGEDGVDHHHNSMIESVQSVGGDVNNESLQEQLAQASSSGENGEGEESATSPESPGFDLEGKLIIDLKDPNRPRFTLEELRQVLLERNELKTKLIEVEEELAYYKPRDDPNASSDALENSDDDRYQGEEVLVYGPINKEPDEKITGKKDSGIRKFFSFLFTSDIKSASPRHRQPQHQQQQQQQTPRRRRSELM